MFSGLLQDWTTFDGAGTAAFAQPRPDWLDLAAYADVVFWLEVRAVTNPGAGNVVLTYETAPAMDESLFQPLGAVTLVPSGTPVLTEIKLGANPLVPLARFVRWNLAGTAAGNWSVTFRVHTLANKSSPGSVAGFDPATLALSGWWRASYAGSPWTATASAGSSGTNGDLTEANNPPTTGAAQNGFTPAAFDGATTLLSNTNALFPTFVTTTAGSVACLFYANTAATAAAAGAPFDNPCFITDTGPFFCVAFDSSGVRAGLFDGVNEDLAVACGTGAYHLAQVRFDGTNLQVRVDSGAWSSLAAGSIGGASGTTRVGQNYNVSFFDGRMLELLTAGSTLDDATFDNIKSYCNLRYGLSL